MVLIEGAKIVFDFDNITVKVFKVYHTLTGKDFPRHCHGKNFYELHYIASGSGSLITDDKTYPLKANSFYMTGPYVYHEQRVDKQDPTEEYCIQMEMHYSQNIPANEASKLLMDTAFWIGEGLHDVNQIFKSISEECARKNTGYLQSIKSLISLLLVSLVRNYCGNAVQPSYERDNPDYKRLIIIESSFLSDFATLTLSELSKRLNLSNRQTQRLLMQNYQHTFSELKRDARFNKAKELIRSGVSVSDAAYAVGYSDVRSLTNKSLNEKKGL
ncbi:MAG: AraC family transcriptional regulator [Clostridia bacterium]|nr:AraC family transcriptional regulator [Clostridia bacterium]